MRRFRSLAKWKIRFKHASVEDFLSTPAAPGVHTMWHGEQLLDILLEDRGADHTLVLFHGAATDRALTVPILQGSGVAGRAGANLVSISDPTLQMGDIDLAWFLGNRETGQLRPVLTALIQHALTSLKGKHTIFLGASGGGYAAINCGQDFPDSTVVVVNPRLDLNKKPFPGQRMVDYLRVAHDARTNARLREARREFVTNEVADLIPEKLPFDLLLFQNLSDQYYLTRQAVPFIERFRDDPRLFVRFEDNGIGHRPIPPEMLDSIISALTSDEAPSHAVSEAGFARPGSAHPGALPDFA